MSNFGDARVCNAQGLKGLVQPHSSTMNRAPSSPITINHRQSSGIINYTTSRVYTSTPLKLRHDNGSNQTWMKMWHVLLLMDQMIFQLAMWLSWGMHPGEFGELVDWLPGTPLLRAAGAGRFGAFKRLLDAQVPTLVVTKRGMFKKHEKVDNLRNRWKLSLFCFFVVVEFLVLCFLVEQQSLYEEPLVYSSCFS